MLPLLILVLGLAILTLGAELLVRGAAALALRLGLTPLVIGLTVVAFGTSAPELVVSLQAAQRGAADIAVGNVIGSNICNLALILGLCAMIKPLTADRVVISREVPILIIATGAGSIVLLNGFLGVPEGGWLLIGLLSYTVITVIRARRETDQDLGEVVPLKMNLLLSVLLVGGGLIGLLYGSDLFVSNAVELARIWGWSETVIGLTIIAIGTSLPELAISVVAVKKGETDVAIGNVVGSSLFNLLGILGATAVFSGGIQLNLQTTDVIVLMVLTLAIFPLARSGHQIDRREGVLLLSIYVIYTIWLVTTRV